MDGVLRTDEAPETSLCGVTLTVEPPELSPGAAAPDGVCRIETSCPVVPPPLPDKSALAGVCRTEADVDAVGPPGLTVSCNPRAGVSRNWVLVIVDPPESFADISFSGVCLLVGFVPVAPCTGVFRRVTLAESAKAVCPPLRLCAAAAVLCAAIGV